MMHRIGVVVNYCSLERPFLDRCVRECLAFAHDVVVAFGSKLHDGETAEPAEPPQVPHGARAVRYEVGSRRDDDLAWYCNLARLTGFRALVPACEWVLFLDADEIPDGRRMRAFAEDAALDPRTGYKLAMYWYFRRPDMQSLAHEDSAVLVHRSVLDRDPDALLRCPMERGDVVDLAPGGVMRFVADGALEPMLHHYSWVRATPEDLLTKLRTWSHRGQQDWEGRLRAELARPMLDMHTDLVFGKTYRQVHPFFDLSGDWTT